MKKESRVLIAAGGTGGHIYPALAMAEAFLRLHPGVQVEFVGTPSGLENKLVPAKGFQVHHLHIGRLNSNVSWRERLTTLILLPWSMIEALRLLLVRRPDFVIGVGGHASGPLLLMAALLRYPTAIWEPNAIPGLANRILSRYVQESWVVFDDAKAYIKGSVVHSSGVPVRREIESVKAQSTGSKGPFRVFIFGGSQGARGVNTAVMEMVKSSGDWLNKVHIVHQTGAADFERVKQGYGSSLGITNVEVKEYIHDMDQQYAKADLVICRSGTGTLAELAACGKPAVLIPFPFAADDHQRKNAESLVRMDAAEMIVQKDLTPDRLRETIERLRGSPERLKQMSENMRKFHRPQAAEVLVRSFLERMDASAPG